jgi:NADH:ubiquinone oxidoreductase subunit C
MEIYFFIANLINLFFLKYLVCFVIKYTCIILVLNILFYYNFFIDLKNLMTFNFKSLIDLTASHYPDLLNEFELNYCLLSYKFSIRFFLRIFSKKEDLIISLNNIFSSAN